MLPDCAPRTSTFQGRVAIPLDASRSPIRRQEGPQNSVLGGVPADIDMRAVPTRRPLAATQEALVGCSGFPAPVIGQLVEAAARFGAVWAKADRYLSP